LITIKQKKKTSSETKEQTFKMQFLRKNRTENKNVNRHELEEKTRYDSTTYPNKNAIKNKGSYKNKF
jgi:hypothetical protein